MEVISDMGGIQIWVYLLSEKKSLNTLRNRLRFEIRAMLLVVDAKETQIFQIMLAEHAHSFLISKQFLTAESIILCT